jgi:hypothetical protein
LDAVEGWKALARAHLGKRKAEGPRIDLRFGAGFVLLGALIGTPFGASAALFVPAALASVVLVQELSRALLLRSFGHSSVVHVSMTGARTESSGPPLTGSQAAAFAAVGVPANILAAALFFAIGRYASIGGATRFLDVLALWHGAWGIAQALPSLPFRAGEALHHRLRPALRFAHAMASVVFQAVAFFSVVQSMPAMLPLAFLPVAAAMSGLSRSHAEASDREAGIQNASAMARASLAAGEPARALQIAETALERARSENERTRLWETVAWAAVGKGDPFRAHQALGKLPPSSFEPYLVAAYLTTCNRLEEAAALLEEARGAGRRSAEQTKLLLDLCLRRGDARRARELAREDAELLSPDEQTAVEQAVARLGDSVPA